MLKPLTLLECYIIYERFRKHETSGWLLRNNLNKRNSRTAKREIISERKTSSTQENRWKMRQLSREKSAILENAETKNSENKKKLKMQRKSLTLHVIIYYF